MTTWKKVLLIVLAAGAANVLFCIGGAAVWTWWRMRKMPPPGPVVVAIQYDVVPDHPNVSMDALIDRLDRRLNPRGRSPWVEVVPVGPDRLEFGLYEDDSRLFERLDSMLAQTGRLEFQILAHRRMHPREIALADGVGKDRSEVRDGNRLAARWVPIADPKVAQSPTCVTRKVDDGNGGLRTDVLVIHDPEAPRGAHVARANTTLDESDRRAVAIQFNDEGARRMKAITSSHIPDESRNLTYHLGILWNGRLVTAPQLNATITDSAIITDSFTAAEIDEMAGILNAGAFPATFKRVGGPLPRSP